jgi:2-dehydropantoate 2-reductase
MRILVMGAGALGTVAGGFMAQAGHEVVLVGRAAHMDAIRRNGLRLSGIWGEHHVATLATRTSVDGLEAGAFDLILIAVKSYDTRRAVEQVLPLVDRDTLVCAYQNGLGNAEIIAQSVGWARTVGARAIFGARLPEPGHAEVTVIANPTALGVYRPETPADRVRAIAAAMDAAHLPTVYTDSIAAVLWAKVAYNCALNPLSALLDCPYGALAETEYTRSIIREAIRELYAVAQAMRVPLDPPGSEAYLELFFGKLLPPTAAHYASMREDFLRRRRTEIDAINGAIVRYGQEYNVPCPTNAMLTRLVHAREHTLGIAPREA